MNMYTNTKKSKKFILILILLILFNFCYPKSVKAKLMDDIVAAPAKIFWILEEGILTFLNNIFTNPDNQIEENSYEDKDGYETTELNVSLTPDNIIKGRFLLFDANIFKEITNDSNYLDYVEGGSVSEGKKVLRETIAGWYYALRNFAIIALLSVLVYVGIRMILSTVAQDKAKYKVMFKDWLVALCLVVVMHYMMIGILNITSMIIDALGGGENVNMIKSLSTEITGILSEGSADNNYEYNGMGLSDAYAKIIVVAGIIIYTFIFAVKYLKREFTIVFLILLGPVSCITYPIDKISDGKAQAFNKWLTEFIYQVIIQPFHLLLYIVLVGSAVELANANVIYALVCFAVMIPAEKFIKSMFGFKDQLSSPLGAIASTALASKALHAIMGKGKGSSDSGGKDGDSDNDSAPNELPPRTVDKPGLVDGNAENSEEDNTERGTTRQQENRDFESEEEPGGSDSTSDVYQNSDDSTTDAERDTSGEEIDAERDTLGEQMNDEQNSQESEDESEQNSQADHDGNGTESEQTQGQNKFKGWAKDKVNKLENKKFMKIHNQRVSKKYGSTNRKQRWKRRITKGAKAGAKGLLKGGAIGLVGAAAMAGALLTGNGKEALGIAGGIAAYTGKKVWNGGKKTIKGATGAVKDYFNAYRDDMTGKIPFVKSKEEKALEDFKADKKHQEKAVLRYRKNHKGQDPGYEDLENEMNDWFALSRYNLTDDQIDNAIGSFQKLKENGVSESDALNETVYSTKLADDYSKKDFRSEKTMKEAINTIANDFGKYGVPRKVAEEKAEKYLRQAAEIKGVEIALPSTNKTVDVDIPSGEIMSAALGVENSSDFNDVQLQRLNHLTVRLHEEAHMSSREIEKLAKGTADSRATTAHVLDTFEAKVEFLTNRDARQQAKDYVAASTKVDAKNVTDKQVKVEMENRLELLSVGAKPEDMNGILVVDETLYQSHTKDDRQMALDIAGKFSSRQMNESREMDKLIQDTAKKLVKDGRVSGNGIQKATEIVERAANFKGTTAVYTIKE